MPLRPRHAYAAALQRGLPASRTIARWRVTHPLSSGRALLTGPDPPGLGPADCFRGFHHWFLHSYASPSRLPGPSRLAVPTRPVVVGAACRPSWRLPGPAAPSFTGLLRQADGGALSSPPGLMAPRGARVPPSTTASGQPAWCRAGGQARMACPLGPALRGGAEHSRLTAGHYCPGCTTSLGAIHVASTPGGDIRLVDCAWHAARLAGIHRVRFVDGWYWGDRTELEVRRVG
jgi:hypothetical protein